MSSSFFTCKSCFHLHWLFVWQIAMRDAGRHFAVTDCFGNLADVNLEQLAISLG